MTGYVETLKSQTWEFLDMAMFHIISLAREPILLMSRPAWRLCNRAHNQRLCSPAKVPLHFAVIPFFCLCFATLADGTEKMTRSVRAGRAWEALGG